MHNYLSSLHKNLPSLLERLRERLLLLVFLSPCLPVSLSPSLQAQTVDGRNFGVDGFAAYEGEAGTKHYLAGATTGGAAGKVVKAETFSQLQAYLQAKDPYVILLDRDIEPAPVAYVNSIDEGALCAKQDGSEGVKTSYGERILVASNKTLIGIVNPETGKAPLISRITLVMQCVNNIIIRNCRFTMTGVPVMHSGENKIVAWRSGAAVQVGDPDCIGIQADKESYAAADRWGAHIWIDHCEFFNEGSDQGKDRYDGLADCKNNIKWMTISYNHFHTHKKACLSGKGDSDNFDRTISTHHNFYENMPDGSRLPLQRYGHMHYCNNYQYKCGDGYDIRKDAFGYVDACYFEDSKSPVHGKTSDGGRVNVRKDEGYDIIYKNCTNLLNGYLNTPTTGKEKYTEMLTCDWVPTDTWTGYFLNQIDKTADVPEICKKYSGAGKIDIWQTYAQEIPAVDEVEFLKAAKNYSTGPTYDDEGNIVKGADPDPSSISSPLSPHSSLLSPVYDLSGRRLNGEPQHGVYIKDGRVVIK